MLVFRTVHLIPRRQSTPLFVAAVPVSSIGAFRFVVAIVVFTLCYILAADEVVSFWFVWLCL